MTDIPIYRPKFAVLLAAYNGFAWIEEQVESILAQVDVDVTIYINIDLSIDCTHEKCFGYSVRYSNVIVLPYGARYCGAARNFFHLIKEVDFSKFDYISFADQDDIWFEDKLIAAHKVILSRECSGYSGNVKAFWLDGRSVLINKAQNQRKYDFLFESAGPGCSYVLKVSDALLFKDFLLANWLLINEVRLHDWLIYAWFRSNGLAWYIDPLPKMLYRQHSGNQIGANSGFKAMRARLKLLREGWYRAEISKIATLLSSKLPDVPKDLAKNGAIPRIFLFVNFNQLRRRFRDRILLMFIVIVGIY